MSCTDMAEGTQVNDDAGPPGVPDGEPTVKYCAFPGALIVFAAFTEPMAHTFDQSGRDESLCVQKVPNTIMLRLELILPVVRMTV